MTWFDFHIGEATVFVNSEYIVAIAEVGKKTELTLSNGGAVTVDESLNDVIGSMFERVETDTFTASESEETDG